MARIAGIDLPKNKRIVIGLTSIFSIGRTTAEKILAQVGIDESRKVSDLSDDEVNAIRSAIVAEIKV